MGTSRRVATGRRGRELSSPGLTLQQRVDELESQAAFQDELHQHLNDIVARQDLEILALKRQVSELAASLRDLRDTQAGGTSDPASEVPPHY